MKTHSCCQKSTPLEGAPSPPSLWDWRMGAGLVLAGQAMMFGLGISLSPLAFGTLERAWIHGGLALSAILVGVLLGKQLVVNSLKNILQGKLTIESLFLLSTLGAFGGSVLSSLRGVGSVYYEVVAIVLLLYTFGRRIGEYSKTQALQAIHRFAQDWSRAKVRTPSGSIELLPVEQLSQAHVLLVGPGDKVTVDARILKGTGAIQQMGLTGDLGSLFRQAGDVVDAGSYAIDGVFELQPLKQHNTNYGQYLAKIVLDVVSKPSLFQSQVERILGWFIPLVILTFLLTCWGWSLKVSWDTALFHGMSVLLVACPCAMGLATPLAVWRGTGLLAGLGLWAKNPDALHRLSQINAIVFDKTGTLTLPALQLKQWSIHASVASLEVPLRGCVAHLEAHLHHPVAHAFKEVLPQPSLASDAPSPRYQIRSIVYYPAQGLGAEVTLDGAPYRLKIGDCSLVPQASPESFRELLPPLATQAKASTLRYVYIWLDDQPAAIAVLQETLRDNLEATFQACQAAGLELEILTGSQDASPALHGVPVQGSLTPAQKAQRIAALAAKPGARILYVGDALNDLPAMRQSFLTLAPTSGNDLNQTAADALWLAKDFSNLLPAIQLAQKAVRCIWSNVCFSVFYNLIGITLAAAGYLHPITAALLMLASSSLVASRALGLRASKASSNGS